MNFSQKIYQKLASYCAYQERCLYEVYEKMDSLNIPANEHEDYLDKLMHDNFLNEERFALTFAGGKFRIKQWGRIKIKHGLLQKQVDDIFIQKALESLPEAEYYETLCELANKKKELSPEIDRPTMFKYLFAKGYETYLIEEVLQTLAF